MSITADDLSPLNLEPLPPLPSGAGWPSLAQQVRPGDAPPEVDRALLRISWHAQPDAGFGPLRWVEFMPELTGVSARILGLLGDGFPAASPEAGSAFGGQLLEARAPRLKNLLPQMGPTLWHYVCTGAAVRELFARLAAPGDRLRGFAIARHELEFLGAAIALRESVPQLQVAVASHTADPLQHDPFAMDVICRMKPERLRAWTRLLGSDTGRDWLHRQGVPPDMLPVLENLHPNDQMALLGAIDLASSQDLQRHDFIVLPMRGPHPAPDRPDVTDLRMAELLQQSVFAPGASDVRELTHADRKQLHADLQGAITPPLWEAMGLRQYGELLGAWADAISATGPRKAD